MNTAPLSAWLPPKTPWLIEGLGEGAVQVLAGYQPRRCCLLQQGLHLLVCGNLFVGPRAPIYLPSLFPLAILGFFDGVYR